jgi:hypothetical protein
MSPRNLLLAASLALGITETIDIPHTGVPAAVFAAVFFACAAWFRRRRSLIAVAVLSVQFLVEVTQAHTWNVAVAEEVVAMALGTIGLIGAAGVVFERVRNRRAAPGAGSVGPCASSSPAPRV